MKTQKMIIFYVTLTLIVGVIIGWFVHVQYSATIPSKLREIRENSSAYHYINPLLFIETQRLAPEFKTLKDLVQKDVDTLQSQGKAENISVYFRDLNTGKWTGIDENRTYEPGSMLKVLTLITYLKKTESSPSIIEKKLHYEPEVDSGQYYKPEKVLTTGDYTIEKLLEDLIINSDNSAAKILLDNDKTDFITTYNTLELPKIPASNTADFMSPESYSVLFRTLFNSSYLTRSLSEQALFLLTNTAFTKGLVAGVPSGTVVAHKFGENTVKKADGTVTSRELHDCGIVYYPSNPYLLCVMTKGDDFTKLETVISTISKTVYQNIAQKN